MLGGACLIIGGWKAGGEEHDQADSRQQQHQQAEGHIDGSLGQFPALLHFFHAVLLPLLKRQLLLTA